jgi:predicted amidohydrolase YtcJ
MAPIKRWEDGMLDRRDGLKALMATALALGTMPAASAPAAEPLMKGGGASDRETDLTLVNGKIHTMDTTNSVVSSVAIRNGKFAAVGNTVPDSARVIDLNGRTVIPGLVDNHNHFVLLSERPGHDTRLESAASIADVQGAVAARTKTVPPGAWITAMGGWVPEQFAERRLPTRQELDAAAANNPVILFQTFFGPAAVNTRARQFFAVKNITVDHGGLIAMGPAALGALNALRAVQTFADKKQGALDAMAYSASMGVTTNVDMGAFVIPGTPNTETSAQMDTLASDDPFTMHDALLALHREGKVSTRLRIFYLSMDEEPQVSLIAQRVLNSYPGFGDDLVRISGIGEFVTQWPLFKGDFPTNYQAALTLVARHGWPFQQHTLSAREDAFTIESFRKINETTPIADLRWSIAHVPELTAENLAAAKALGIGLALHGFRYLSGSKRGGPPYRMVLDSGINAGAGSDSAQISTLNPWNMIYYMVTGKNAAGILVNDGQTIAREQALRLYTAANGWFLREEDRLGSIEPGKLGDLVVLDRDLFDPVAVPDETIRRVRPAMTIVGGRIIYEAPA